MGAQRGGVVSAVLGRPQETSTVPEQEARGDRGDARAAAGEAAAAKRGGVAVAQGCCRRSGAGAKRRTRSEKASRGAECCC